MALAQARVQPQIQGSSSAWKPTPALIQAQSNLVPLEVVVRRSDGTVITGLSRDRFRVLNAGEAEPLSQFSVVDHGRAPVNAEKPGTGSATAAPAAAATAVRPRYVAIFFDDVNTANGDLEHARNAALRFLRHESAPSDRVGIFTVSGDDQLAFTSQSAALTAAVGKIRAHPRASQYGLRTSCPRITPFEAYQISVLHMEAPVAAAMAEMQHCTTGQPYAFTHRSDFAMDSTSTMEITAQADATWNMTRGISSETMGTVANLVALLGRQPGKRILLLASGGFLSGTLEALQQKITNTALHDNVVINSLDARGEFTEDPARPMDQQMEVGVLPLITFFYEESSKMSADQAKDDTMEQLAQSTGGLFFHNNNDLDLGFRRLGLEPPVTYELAFTPASLPRDGKFHALKVELLPPIKGAVIQARRGYYDPEPLTPAEQLGPALAQAMRDSGQESNVPVGVQVKQESGSVGVHVQFDVSRLAFISAHGRRDQLLDVIAALYDSNGQFVTGQQGTIDLALDNSHYKHFQKAGLGATLGLHAPKGSYRLRIVVGEASDGKLSMFTRTVTVH